MSLRSISGQSKDLHLLRPGRRITMLPRSTGKERQLMKKKDACAQEGCETGTALTPGRLKQLKEQVSPCETE